MHQYRITKYNPAFRDAAGAFKKQDWTSFCDIGGSFDGVVLSKEDYLRVEAAYIESAVRFFTEDGVSALRAICVENHAASVRAPSEGAAIAEGDLREVCRSILREEYWCKLEANGRFLHFGYDYYMYVGVQGRCDTAIAWAQAHGLFVEQFDTPYAEEEPKTA